MNEVKMTDLRVFLKYGYRQHKSTLEESLKTSVAISSRSFDNHLQSGRFRFYCYDERCNQILWLSDDTEMWLFIELDVCLKRKI